MAIFSFLTWPLALMGLVIVGIRTMMNDVDDPIGHRMLGPRTITPVYDFIIVGGGTSGAVLANRLTEDPSVRVLLLEAGSDGSYLSEVPAFPFLLWNTEMDWHYFSEPQPDSCLAFQGGQCVWFKGKMLGGSSALNQGVYTRGNQKDFDNWERLGNSGWGWEDVFPLFKKSEDFAQRDNRSGIDLDYHGTGGYMPTTRPPVYTKLFDHYIQAGKSLGYDENDYNGKNQTGFAFVQTYNREGVRYSTATGYLRPIMNRDNLEIMVMSRATKILIDPSHDRAVGVSFRRAGRDFDVLATKEVIVSAGVVESPKLLMLSGVGPSDDLRRFGLHVAKDLPGVGKNMRSHVGAGGIYFTTSQPVGLSLFRDLTIRSLASYAFRGGGHMNNPGGLEGVAFVHSNYSTDPNWPDVEILFGSTHIASDGGLVYRRLLNLTEEVWETYRDLRWRDGFMMLPFPTRPKSRGEIRLRSTDPEESPQIFGNYFKDPQDIKVTIDAIKFLLKLADTPAMKEIGAELYAHPLPGCEKYSRYSDEYWECHIRHFTYLHWHDTSTCKMGPESDPMAVVDSRLRVHGINALRVVDASVMPEIVSGDIQASSIMIGEKAANMIKEDNQLLTARSRLLRI